MRREVFLDTQRLNLKKSPSKFDVYAKGSSAQDNPKLTQFRDFAGRTQFKTKVSEQTYSAQALKPFSGSVKCVSRQNDRSSHMSKTEFNQFGTDKNEQSRVNSAIKRQGQTRDGFDMVKAHLKPDFRRTGEKHLQMSPGGFTLSTKPVQSASVAPLNSGAIFNETKKSIASKKFDARLTLLSADEANTIKKVSR